MNNSKKLYQRLLDTDWNLSQGCIHDLITWDEYNEFNKYASRIEGLLEAIYGYNVVREWRFSH